MWAEVKPTNPTPEEMAKCVGLVRASGKGCLLLVGPPDFTAYQGLTLDCGELTTTSYLLDPDLHGRRFYQQHRLYSDPGEMLPEDFSPQYQIAVHAARSERFEKRDMPAPGHEPFNPTPAELSDAWGNAR